MHMVGEYMYSAKTPCTMLQREHQRTLKADCSGGDASHSCSLQLLGDGKSEGHSHSTGGDGQGEERVQAEGAAHDDGGVQRENRGDKGAAKNLVAVADLHQQQQQ